MDLMILVTRMEGKEDVLIIKTYLVDAEVPLLCGKRTLEGWNFQIDGRDKSLEITSRTDGSRMRLKKIDMKEEHYGIILET